MSFEYSLWQSEVRDYEIDYQGIVNNAHYFHYFDQARTKYLEKFGLNIVKCASEKKNIVLLKTAIQFKKSLVSGDVFSVVSKMNRISRFKFQFSQEIFLQSDQKLIASSESIVACIDAQGKPCYLEGLKDLEVTQKNNLFR